jgi:hypothetical protein
MNQRALHEYFTMLRRRKQKLKGERKKVHSSSFLPEGYGEKLFQGRHTPRAGIYIHIKERNEKSQR